MKFQRCDMCGKEKPVEKSSNLNDYDQIGFIYPSKTKSAEYFDVCEECQQKIRSKFPKEINKNEKQTSP